MTAPSSPALGDTDDATVLVPGDASAMRSFSDVIRDFSDKISQTGEDLRGVRAKEWRGDAADAFEDAFSQVPKLWFDASDLLSECSTALDTFADSIHTAQVAAQQAIDTWNAGEEATETSRNNYNQSVLEYNDAVAKQPLLAGPRPWFVDDGAAQRSEAQEILNDARTALDTAGNDALMALVRSGGGTLTQGSNEGPGAESSWSWGSATSDQWKQQWGKDGWAGLSGPPSLGLSAVLASASASAWVWRAKGSVEKPIGPANGMLYANGEVSALSAGADASLSVSESGVSLSAAAEAELFGASGSAGYKTDYTTVEISGDVGAGAYADGKATIGAQGVDLNAEVLVGAKATVDGEVSVGGIGLTGTAEGWAGAGAGINGTFGYDDGKLTIGASAGLAWGLGGSLGAGVTLDFEEMGNTAGDLWDSATEWF